MNDGTSDRSVKPQWRPVFIECWTSVMNPKIKTVVNARRIVLISSIGFSFLVLVDRFEGNAQITVDLRFTGIAFEFETLNVVTFDRL